MRPSHDPDHLDPLEQFIEEQLRRLPPLKAPPTLAPRVLTAIRQQENRAWWRRSCWSWPWPCQLVFLFLTLGLLAMAGAGGFKAVSTVQLIFLQGWEAIATGWGVPQSGTLAQTLASAATTLASHPYFLPALGIAILAYLACVALGTLGFKLAFKRIE